MGIFVWRKPDNMTIDKNQKVIRISKAADDKLSEIAKRSHLSKSKAASRIISHYFSSNIAVDLPNPEDFTRMLNVLSNLEGKYSKLIGPVERTEDFIKSLLRENRSEAYSATASDQEPDEPGRTAPSEDPNAPRVLDLLGRLLAMARTTTDFEGRAAMQIRLSQEEFSQIKLEYDQLCISRNL